MAMFVEVINTSPYGALRLVADGEPVEVAAGGTLKCSPELADRLLEQHENWQPAKQGGGNNSGQEQS